MFVIHTKKSASENPLFSCEVPLFYGTILSWMEYQPKLNGKYKPFLHCISSFKVLLIDTGTCSFMSCCLTLALTSADITFYNILELHST